jgi:hypothetical protein
MDELTKPRRQPVRENLRENFPKNVYEGYGLLIPYGNHVRSFRQQHHDCLIDRVELPSVQMPEHIESTHHFKFDSRPCHLQEAHSEPVRSRRLVQRQRANDHKDLLLGEPHRKSGEVKLGEVKELKVNNLLSLQRCAKNLIKEIEQRVSLSTLIDQRLTIVIERPNHLLPSASIGMNAEEMSRSITLLDPSDVRFLSHYTSQQRSKCEGLQFQLAP